MRQGGPEATRAVAKRASLFSHNSLFWVSGSQCVTPASEFPAPGREMGSDHTISGPPRELTGEVLSLPLRWPRGLQQPEEETQVSALSEGAATESTAAYACM